MAFGHPLPPPGEPPLVFPVDIISGARAELHVGRHPTSSSLPEKHQRLQEINDQDSEAPSVPIDACEDAFCMQTPVEQITELDRASIERPDEELKAWTQDEKRPSWVPPQHLTRVSNDDLQEAALRGDLGLVRRLVHAGASVNAPMVLESEDEIMTLLHVLALRPEIPNGTRIIGEIIRASVDINARSSTGLTPLMCACKHKHVGAAELLVGAQVDVAPEDDIGRTALTYAVITDLGKGHSMTEIEEVGLEVLRMLRQVGVNLDNGGRGACPPIVEAVKQQNLRLVREMIELGATPDGLPEAASIPSVELVKMLIAAKANPLVTDEAGFTALQIAEQRGNDEMVGLLKAHVGYLQDINHHHVSGVAIQDGHPKASERVAYCST